MIESNNIEQDTASVDAPGTVSARPASSFNGDTARTASPENGVERPAPTYREARERPTLGRALELSEDAAIIYRTIAGELTRPEAAALLSVSTNTVGRRIAVWVAAGANALERTKHSNDALDQVRCTNDAAHAIAAALVSQERVAQPETLTGCHDTASHVLGLRAIAATREARIADTDRPTHGFA